MKREILSVVLPLAILVLGASCKTRNVPAQSQTPADVPPPGYPENQMDPNAPGQTPGEQSGGRFGYTGTEASVPSMPDPPASNATTNAPRDVRDIPSSGAATTPGTTPSTGSSSSSSSTASTGKPSAADMPYATAVPGDPLSVTLPSVGKISIEKYDSSDKPTGQPLPRGTQVMIPDPNNPGKKIYFKVP